MCGSVSQRWHIVAHLRVAQRLMIKLDQRPDVGLEVASEARCDQHDGALLPRLCRFIVINAEKQ